MTSTRQIAGAGMGCDIDNKETGIWKSIFWMFLAGYYTLMGLRI
jgi:hypothetical protein